MPLYVRDTDTINDGDVRIGRVPAPGSGFAKYTLALTDDPNDGKHCVG